MELFEWLIPNCLKIGVAAILFLLASLLVPRLYKTFHAYKHLSKIPGPNAIFTNLYLIKMARKGTINVELLDLIHGLKRTFSKSGISLIWFGHIPTVYVYTPQLAEIILTREESLERPPEARFLAPVAIGNTIVIASPLQEWRKRRKLLNPTFNVGIIERYLEVFNKYAAIFVKKLEQRDAKQPIDLLPIIKICTMNIICETAMGVDIKTRERSNAEFIDAFLTVTKIALQRVVQPWLYPDVVFKSLPIGRRLQKNMDILTKFTREIIAQKKIKMLSDPKMKKQVKENFVEVAKQMQVAFIDLLIYQHLYGDERLSEEDVLGEVSTFIFGGFETCSVTLSWALYLIGNDPRVQKAIHDELDTVLDHERDQRISVADIKNMKYLNCVFKETLRLYPPGGAIFRYTQEQLKIDEYTIPAETPCVVLVHSIHRDPHYFPKPECFIPERFLNNEECHSYTYIPFAAGPKNCIGQRFAQFEAITLLAVILRNFSVKSANKRDTVRISMNPISTPFDPLLVYLIPRGLKNGTDL